MAAVGRKELQRTMRPVLVVVPAVDVEHVLEVAAADDEDSVEAASTNRTHPPLGGGVRIRVWGA
jgi:hypothetical protein